MAKRITKERVKKWAIGGGITGIPIAVLLVWFMFSLGSIDVTGFTGDVVCEGTELDPCIAIINITVHEDIFIYPDADWGSTAFITDVQPKSVKVFRSWGSSWREIKLNQSCTGTWCGLSSSKDVRKFSFAFREERDYTLKFELLKNSPEDTLKWTFGPVDPFFYGREDNKVNYSKNDLKFEMRDALGNKRGEVELTSHKSVDEKLGVEFGNDIRVMTYDFNYSKKVIDGIGDVLFINMDTGEIENKSYHFEYWNPEKDIIEDYERFCEVKKYIRFNGTETRLENCVDTQTGTHFEGDWDYYNSTDIPNSPIKIALVTDVDFGDYYDGQWKIDGRYIEKHAEWFSSDYEFRRCLTGLSAYLPLPVNGSSVTDLDGNTNTEFIYGVGDSDTCLYYNAENDTRIANGTNEFFKVQTKPMVLNKTGTAPSGAPTDWFTLDALQDDTLPALEVMNQDNATVHSSVVKASGGVGDKMFNGYEFPGTNGVRLSQSSTGIGNTANGSLVIWMKSDDASSGTFHTLFGGTAGNTDFVATATATETLRWFLGSTKVVDMGSTHIYAANETFMYTFTWDTAADNYTVYKNTTLLITSAITTTTAVSTTMFIGCRNTDTACYDGIYYDIKGFDYRLNSSDIATLFNTGVTLGAQEVEAGVSTTLLFPIGSFNSSVNDVTFSMNSTPGSNNLTNITLNIWYSNTTLYNTTLRNLNGSSTIITNITENGIPDGDFIWNGLTFDDSAASAWADSNRTFTVDTISPDITFSVPTETNNSFLDRNYIEINVSSNDSGTGLDSIVINLFDSSHTEINSSLTGSSPNYINFSGLNNGVYYFNATANDSANNLNITETRIITLDTVAPSISFSDPTEANNTLFDRDYVFVNISVTESNTQNITFVIANSTGIYNTTTRSMPTNLSNTSINFTGLAAGVYTYNVTVFDKVHKSDLTETRHITLTSFTLTLGALGANVTAELGTVINVIGNSTANTTVCLDVIHPDFGINYSCGFRPQIINVTPVSFVNNSFTNGLNVTFDTNKTFDLFNISIDSHQYDEADSITINVSGLNGPRHLYIFHINSTPDTSNQSDLEKHIDRFFSGTFFGQKLQQDSFGNTSGHERTFDNLTYQSGSEKFFNLFLDDSFNGTIDYTFYINISGFLSGFTYIDGGDTTGSEGFDNYTSFDTITSNASLDLSGAVMSANTSEVVRVYDNFDIGSGANSTLWTRSIVGSCDSPALASESGGNMVLTARGDSGTCTSTVTSDLINRFESGVVNTSIQVPAHAIVSGSFNRYLVLYGGTAFWTHFCERSDPGDTSSMSADINMSISKVNKTHYRATLYGSDSCREDGGATVVRTYTGNETDFEITHGSASHQLKFSAASSRSGAQAQLSTLNVRYVNRTLFERGNSSVQSNSVFAASSNIISVSGNISGALGPGNFNQTIEFFLSADNGNNWESVGTVANSNNATRGIIFSAPFGTHVFSNQGKNLKWKAHFTADSWEKEVFTLDLSGITSVSTAKLFGVELFNTEGYPQDIEFDFGDNSVIDATFTGELNATNSPQIINLSRINISSAFKELNRFTGFESYDNTFLIPVSVYSNNTGIITINEVNLTYDPNPIIINVSNLSTILETGVNDTLFRIPIDFTNSTNITSRLNVTDLVYKYAGGNYSLLIKLHDPAYSLNLTRMITYFYSRWDFSIVPANINFIEFIPTGPTAKNVTPFGQTSTKSILNLTNLGYGGVETNLSIYLNSTLACVDLTLSTTSNKTQGFIINSSWNQIRGNFTYLNYTNISLWADYSCSFGNYTLFQPFIFFRQCPENVDFCSEALT